MKFHIESAGDWPEDFQYDNGMYMNTCCDCKHTFIGHKHRIICKLCYNPITEKIKSDNEKLAYLIKKMESVSTEIETIRKGMTGNLSSV